MKETVQKFVKHPLISGSTVIFTSSLFANILSWLFNLFIGGRHLLSVSDYGIYSALMSFWVIFGIFQGSFTSIFAKFSAKYRAKDDDTNLDSLIHGGFRFVLLFSTSIFLILILVFPIVTSFLHIEFPLVFLIYLCIFISLIASLPLGILQGELRFYAIAVYTNAGPLLKIIFGLFFVLLGFKVFGVLIAVLLSTVLPFFYIAYIVRRQYKPKKNKSINEKLIFGEFKKYSFEFFLATLGITIISNTDILFVKHFFSSTSAGQYAALSIMGKAIFYITSPIYFTFFPLIAQKKEKNENVRNVLILAGILIAGISSILSCIYFFFPGLILKIFFPAKEYGSLASLLGPYSLFILIFALATLLNNYFLSIGRTSIYKINLSSSFLFIVLIYFFHANLVQIILVLFATASCLFLSLLCYGIIVSNKNRLL